MLNRKHIRAPRTFNPGRGAPKEHLAYMSKAEMEMLRVLTDGVVEDGPKGIPSFEFTGGTKGNTPAGPSSHTTSNSVGGNSYSSPSSRSTTGSTTGSSAGGSLGNGNRSGASGMAAGSGSKAPSGPSGGGTAAKSASPATPAASSAPRAPAASAAAAKASAAKTPSTPPSTSTSRSTAAPQALSGIGSPGRAPVAVSAPPSVGAGRSGAAGMAAKKTTDRAASPSALTQSQKNAYVQAGRLIGQPAGNTASYPGQGQGLRTNGAPVVDRNGRPIGPNDRTDFNAAAQSIFSGPNVDQARFSNWANQGLSRINKRSTDQTDVEARTMAGEVGGYSTEDIAAAYNAFNNRMGLGYSWGGAQGMPAFDANGLRTGKPNTAFRRADPGTDAYNKAALGMAAALDPASAFSQTAPGKVLNATHYLTPDSETAQAARASRVGLTGSTWSQSPSFTDTRTEYGPHVFGNAENTADRVARARGGEDASTVTAAAVSPAPAAAPSTGGFSLASSPVVPRPVPRPEAASPPPRPTARPPGLTGNVERNAYDTQRAVGVPRANPLSMPVPTARPPGLTSNVERNAYDTQRAMGVPTARPPGIGRPPVPTARPPSQNMQQPVVGAGMSFAPDLPGPMLGGLSRNAYDTQRFDATVDREAYDTQKATAEIGRNPFDTGRFSAAVSQPAYAGVPAPGKQVYDRVPQMQGPMQPPAYAGKVASGTYTEPYNVPPAPFRSGATDKLPPGYAERYGLNPAGGLNPAPPVLPSAGTGEPAPPPTGGWFNAAYKAGTDAVNTVKQKKAEVDQQVKEAEKKYGPITEGKVKLALWLNGIVNGGGGNGGAPKGSRSAGNDSRGSRFTEQERTAISRALAQPAPAAVAPVAPPPPVNWDYYNNVKTREQTLRELLGEEWYA